MRTIPLLLILFLFTFSFWSCDTEQRPWGHLSSKNINPDITQDDSLVIFINYIENQNTSNTSISLLNLNNKKTETLFNIEFGEHFTPKWSSDHTKILFQEGILYLNNNKIQEYIPNKVHLGVCHTLQWSPDDSSILIGDNCKSLIYVSNDKLSSMDELYVKGKYPHWMPNGTDILYIKEGNKAICISNLSNSKDITILESSTDKHKPIPSPDGRKIIFQENGNLICLDINSQNEDFIDIGLNPVWKNNHSIIYQKDNTTKPFNTHLWEIDLKTKMKNKLTQ